MADLTPCLWFAAEAEEAARFYAALIPDSRVDSVTTLPADSPSGPAGSVSVVEFTLMGRPFMAMAAGPLDRFNHAVSFMVPCETQAEIDRLWNALSEGGSTEQCGWLKDRYGVSWQIVPAVLGAMMKDADRARARRVAEAMLGMVKFDIAGLERAYDGRQATGGDMSEKPRSFIWYELMTTDIDAAAAFYGSVVGWRAQAQDPGGMRYTLFHAGETPVAGLMTLSDAIRDGGGRPCWLGYIQADDVDAAAAAVKTAGGAVHHAPADIPGVGRFAVVADPQGVVFQLFKPLGGDIPPAPPMSPGHIGWHELYAQDWERAFAFYAGQFGWTKAEALDMGPMGTYQLFAAGGPAIGGMMDKPPAMPVAAWLFYFNVEGLDSAMARVGDGGGQIVNGPHQVPGGSWIVQCLDPQGAMFAIVAQSR